MSFERRPRSMQREGKREEERKRERALPRTNNTTSENGGEEREREAERSNLFESFGKILHSAAAPTRAKMMMLTSMKERKCSD